MVSTSVPMCRLRRATLGLLCAVWPLVAAAPPAAAQAPAQAPSASPAAPKAQTFHRTVDYVLKVDGKTVTGARFFASDEGGAYLILGATPPGPVLIQLRSKEVATLAAAPAERGGVVTVPAGAARKPQGQYEIQGSTPAFTVDGKRVRLENPVPLLGLQPAAAVRSYNPEYERKAALYRPDEAALARLTAIEEPVRLRVYFGTWCSVCSQVLPGLFKVTDSVKNPRLTVEYYGLPEERGADPEPARMGLQGVPTGIVYRKGEEVGRITGKQWQQPEVALRDILAPAVN
jgi:hypothetical protein